MLRSRTLIEQHEPLFLAAVLAAEASAEDAGFRQRDVRFFAELFENWLDTRGGEQRAAIHNTQIQRQLEALNGVGWARSTGRKPPRFRLTRLGIGDLLRRLAQRTSFARLEEFFFVFHFLDAYGPHLREMAARGARRSPALTREIDQLVDPRQLVARERERTREQLTRLEQRIDDARQTSELARALFARRMPLSEVIAGVEARFPYELNSQKPLRELLGSFPEPWRAPELVEVSRQRAEQLWGAQRALLRAYDQLLLELVTARARGSSS